ncbi:hypothetical protein [Halapricum desulfuricans]|uniref:Uncharacterized protein n=1 Tax=Halapricum desulfuricans TaxID=2841257 RepID=A0A897N5P8_9EURY|nr:hypothetical protein [Halapricum desulfuricans]QSG06389.1 hypothetical protein HSR121_2057 [Halapricum desulfuricans]
MDHPSVERYYGGEGIDYNGQMWIPTRVFVDEANAGDLDTLEAQTDAFRIYPAAIETALNDLGAFPVDLTARQWALLFSKFLMPE